MFDVGFWELSIIALVALVVIGPERLPKVARTAGHWLGRGRRFISSVKADIDQEIKSEELKEILEKQAQMANPLHEILDETKDDLNQIKQETASQMQDFKDAVDSDQPSDNKKPNQTE
ncbi:MAG: Sec-independent protein translocase protein TatB [Candidatus Thiodiazotropha sp. DIVDIV]